MIIILYDNDIINLIVKDEYHYLINFIIVKSNINIYFKIFIYYY